MKNNFSKYQGLGNDFIIFDARGNNLDKLFTENKDNFIGPNKIILFQVGNESN